MRAFFGCALLISVFVVGYVPLAKSERFLKRTEIMDLYLDNSWVWKDGAGYFGPKGRFLGVGGVGAKQFIVRGRWHVSQPGELCFSGVWKQKGKSRGRFQKTCFEHKISAGQILQRRKPGGDWYVFKHNPVHSEDQKLESGNTTGIR